MSKLITLDNLSKFWTEVKNRVCLKTEAEVLVASAPAAYHRQSLPTSAKTSITIPKLFVNIGDNGYVQNGSNTIALSTSSNWDSSTYTTAANRAGKDFYIYACQPTDGTTVPKIILSANSTVPTGYTATSSRKIGGFHCLCADVGTISGHTLSGYIKGDILPASVWDLLHRPISSPEGMVWSGKEWVDIYLASWDGSKLISAYRGTIVDGGSSKAMHGELFAEEFGKIGKHLPSRDSFCVFAKGSNEKTNIYGSSDPGTTGGHRDTASRRMISNIGCEDCCGALWQWASDVRGASNEYVFNSELISGMIEQGAQTESDSGSHWITGYKWQSDGRGTANIQLSEGVNIYGLALGAFTRIRMGGNYNDGEVCGSRAVVTSSLSSMVDASTSARGISEPMTTIL